MTQSPLFASGTQLASLAASSGLLDLSWEAIQAAYQDQAARPLPVRLKIIDHQNYTVAAFVTSRTADDLVQEGGRALASSESLRQAGFLHFEFLLSGRIPSFFVHRAAVEHFNECLGELSKLKAEWVDQKNGKLLKDTLLIITGLSLGGSVASLFTLWLLHAIDRTSSKLPLCVTFGSPLLGDRNFQEAISDYSNWNSRFLHVACGHDTVPRSFILPGPYEAVASTSQTSLYKPFGTFLFCSQFECACVGDPEVISMLLLESSRNQDLNEGVQDDLYGRMLVQIKLGIYCRGRMQLDMLVNDGSYEVGSMILLEAAGVNIAQDQQRQRTNDILHHLRELEIFRLEKQVAFNPSRKLNEVKKRMAHLEWYKKVGKNRGIGYYDSYKCLLDRADVHATTLKKFLTDYWDQTVMDAARKPQKEGAYYIRMAWLYGGTNYRRMVEPLEIAEYYREGDKSDYENHGRPEHFKLLEKWQREDPASSEAFTLTERKKQNVSHILTEDSLFWARVEDAIIRCRILKNAASSAAEKHEAEEYLRKFEEYIMREIHKYALSPEVFLPKSSFMMKLWPEFIEICDKGFHPYHYNPYLIDFMQHRKYKLYEIGRY